MSDGNPLFLKLYYVYLIQRRGLEHLVATLKSGGHDGLLQFNTAYVSSLMSEQQRHMWPAWVDEVSSKMVGDYMDRLEASYGVLSDVHPCTHLEEIFPETKTALILESE